jgi:putative ABC transport system substrate-binding protein
MRRRDLIKVIAGSAAVWLLTAPAQQPAMPVVGYLYLGSPERTSRQVAAFHLGLTETGYVEGRNVAIEYRWAEGHFERLPALAADLVDRKVAVIVTPFSLDATRAAKAATTTIPIIFTTGLDPFRPILSRA